MLILEEGGACPSNIDVDMFFIHNLTGFTSVKRFGWDKEIKKSMYFNGKNAAEYIKRDIKNKKHGDF